MRGALARLGEKGFEPGEVVLHGWSTRRATDVHSGPGAGVAAIIEEAGNADLPMLLRDRIPEVSGLPHFFVPGIFLAARLFLGLVPHAKRPVEVVAYPREERVPLFVIHWRARGRSLSSTPSPSWRRTLMPPSGSSKGTNTPRPVNIPSNGERLRSSWRRRVL